MSKQRPDPKIEMLATSVLKPYDKNPRQHPENQLALLEKAIKEFGFTVPILIDAKNQIIAGHGRLVAAQRAGMDKVPCIRATHLTEAQKRAYVLADNRLSQLSTWDETLLREELIGVKASGVNLFDLGFDTKELDDLLKPQNGLADTVDEASDELPGAAALKDDMSFPSKLHWGIPELRTDMLAKWPKKAEVWGGEDYSGEAKDDTWYLWTFRTGTLRGAPRDRLIACFYIDDHKFDCLWEEPAKYAAKLLNLGVRVAIAPNYSLWHGQAEAVHLWATYRARWVSRYLQEAGIAIVPDINWLTLKSFEFTLLGIPKNAPAVAVQLNNVGTPESRAEYVHGLRFAMDALKPQRLVAYTAPNGQAVLDAAKLDVPVTVIESRSALFNRKLGEKSATKKGKH